ncbi:hypothetical protein [Xanthomonas populi]|uniref:hypothetical protein n=1 Tax=Xanthomonas populi TaxID=53414 RepID=UPI00142DAC43|nr:hypothetical protein [Xanthomonas populi]
MTHLVEGRQGFVKNLCTGSELAYFLLFFTQIPADPLAGDAGVFTFEASAGAVLSFISVGGRGRQGCM